MASKKKNDDREPKHCPKWVLVILAWIGALHFAQLLVPALLGDLAVFLWEVRAGLFKVGVAAHAILTLFSCE